MDSKGVFADILSRLNSLGKRLTTLETYEYIKLYPCLTPSNYLVHANIADGITYDSTSLRGVQGISDQAKGFFGTLWITPIVATVDVFITPGNSTPGVYSQQYKWAAVGIGDFYHYSQSIFCSFGPTGNILIKPVGANVEVFIVAAGYWM